MIHVIAVITAKPGKREAILQAFRANVPAVRAEKGCIEYGAAVDADNALPFQTQWGPDTFLVIEKWDSMDALRPTPPRRTWPPTAPSPGHDREPRDPTSCRRPKKTPGWGVAEPQGKLGGNLALLLGKLFRAGRGAVLAEGVAQ